MFPEQFEYSKQPDLGTRAAKSESSDPRTGTPASRRGGDPQGANEGTLVTGIALDQVCSRGDPERGPSSEPGQRRNGLSPERRGRSAVRFRPLHPNKNLHVRSRSSLV